MIRKTVTGLALGILCAAGPAVAGPILISEVLYDAVGSDSGGVFVELFGPAGLALDGYTLEGVTGADGAVGPVLGLTGLVPADGLFVVADEDAGTTAVVGADLLLNFDFQNGPDSIVLRDPGGAVLDALGYGVFGPGEVFAGEGSPAIDPPAGQSLARRFANLDTDDNALDFLALETPTPGAAPLAVPEPVPVLLVGLCLALLGPLRRKRRREPPATAR